MPRGKLVLSAVDLGFSIIFAGSGLARAQTEEPVYGQQLMTQQEMREYRQKMRAATSDEERQQLRLQHHQEMQERAKKKGVTLPDAPPARGMGRGMGPGQGMAPGQGMGPGRGMGPGQHGPRGKVWVPGRVWVPAPAAEAYQRHPPPTMWATPPHQF